MCLTLGLLLVVNWGCCDKTLLLCKTCLHADCCLPSGYGI